MTRIASLFNFLLNLLNLFLDLRTAFFEGCGLQPPPLEAYPETLYDSCH